MPLAVHSTRGTTQSVRHLQPEIELPACTIASLVTVHCDVSPAYACVLQWERLKKAGMAPGPRASFGLAAHKKRVVLFGGITDQKGKVIM